MINKIYIIPNLFTLGNLVSGFYATILALRGDFTQAAMFIILAAVLDSLDGRIARLTNSTSRFGVEFDSLADLVSFGMAPALMLYVFALEDFGRIGWLSAMLLPVCGALRLARFNVETINKKSKSSTFTGLPIPAAALTVTAYILAAHLYGWPAHKLILPFLVVAISYLMVSNIPYASMKGINLGMKESFRLLVIAALAIFILMMYPYLILFISTLSYVLSGPLTALYLHRKQFYARSVEASERHIS